MCSSIANTRIASSTVGVAFLTAFVATRIMGVLFLGAGQSIALVLGVLVGFQCADKLVGTIGDGGTGLGVDHRSIHIGILFIIRILTPDNDGHFGAVTSFPQGLICAVLFRHGSGQVNRSGSIQRPAFEGITGLGGGADVLNLGAIPGVDGFHAVAAVQVEVHQVVVAVVVDLHHGGAVSGDGGLFVQQCVEAVVLVRHFGDGGVGQTLLGLPGDLGVVVVLHVLLVVDNGVVHIGGLVGDGVGHVGLNIRDIQLDGGRSLGGLTHIRQVALHSGVVGRGSEVGASCQRRGVGVSGDFAIPEDVVDNHAVGGVGVGFVRKEGNGRGAADGGGCGSLGGFQGGLGVLQGGLGGGDGVGGQLRVGLRLDGGGVGDGLLVGHFGQLALGSGDGGLKIFGVGTLSGGLQGGLGGRQSGLGIGHGLGGCGLGSLGRLHLRLCGSQGLLRSLQTGFGIGHCLFQRGSVSRGGLGGGGRGGSGGSGGGLGLAQDLGGESGGLGRGRLQGCANGQLDCLRVGGLAIHGSGGPQGGGLAGQGAGDHGIGHVQLRAGSSGDVHPEVRGGNLDLPMVIGGGDAVGRGGGGQGDGAVILVGVLRQGGAAGSDGDGTAVIGEGAHDGEQTHQDRRAQQQRNGSFLHGLTSPFMLDLLRASPWPARGMRRRCSSPGRPGRTPEC